MGVIHFDEKDEVNLLTECVRNYRSDFRNRFLGLLGPIALPLVPPMVKAYLDSLDQLYASLERCSQQPGDVEPFEVVAVPAWTWLSPSSRWWSSCARPRCPARRGGAGRRGRGAVVADLVVAELVLAVVVVVAMVGVVAVVVVVAVRWWPTWWSPSSRRWRWSCARPRCPAHRPQLAAVLGRRSRSGTVVV